MQGAGERSSFAQNSTPIDQERRLTEIVLGESWRVECLKAVRSLQLPDAWIGAGFVRNAVWNALNAEDTDFSPPPEADIDVVYFDPAHTGAEAERELEQRLTGMIPGRLWSVTNQARMHRENGDPAYTSSLDAIRSWPETATAVAVRLRGDDSVELMAPYGLVDIFAMRVRPTPRFAAEKVVVYRARVEQKQWTKRWPRVRVDET